MLTNRRLEDGTRPKEVAVWRRRLAVAHGQRPRITMRRRGASATPALKVLLSEGHNSPERRYLQ